MFFCIVFQSRDLSIAYCLVIITYLLVGVLFYAAFPLEKSCIHQVWTTLTHLVGLFLYDTPFLSPIRSANVNMNLTVLMKNHSK